MTGTKRFTTQPRKEIAALLAAIAIAVGILASHGAQDRNKLWEIENETCFPHPDQCVAVDRSRGFVVFKDKNGIAQLLLMPSIRITGIESPELLRPGSVNYFGEAWQARNLSSILAKLSPDHISLVVNSHAARSQDQLHIHIDCLSEEARQQIFSDGPEVTAEWEKLATPLLGHPYFARRVADIGKVDPFKLVAQLPGAKEDMGRWTLVVAGTAKGSFVLLADQSNPATNDRAWGEEVQDHSCKAINVSAQ